jgi:glycine cleavage system H protein
MADSHFEFDLPLDRFYDASRHLWVQPTVDAGRVVVGIDALGLEYIGDLAYIQCAPKGAHVRRGEPMGSLEAAKMTDILSAPISGQIIAVNEAVLRNPSLVNRDPYGTGWLAEIRPECWREESMQLVSGSRIAGYRQIETERLHSANPVR